MLPAFHLLERIEQVDQFTICVRIEQRPLHWRERALRFDLIFHATILRPPLNRFFLLLGIAAQPHHQIGKIDLVRIEVGTVDASEFHLVAQLDPAAAAHTGTVNHDGVETNHRLDSVRTGYLGARLHHERWPNGDDLIDVRVRRNCELDPIAHESLDADRAVVSAQQQLIAARTKLVLPEDQILAAETENADDVGAVLLEAASLRKDRCHPQTAANAYDLLRGAEWTWYAHGAHQRVESSSDLTGLLHLLGGLAHRLHN